MSDTETASWIAALERARAELEGALSVAGPGGVRRPDSLGGSGDADWAGYERALKGNPVYRCWAQLSETIEELRRQAEARAQVEPHSGSGAAKAPRRVSLRDVLEHIRSDPGPLPAAEPLAAVAEAVGLHPAVRGPEAASASAPAGSAVPPAPSGHPPPEAEEATVSFVIREPVPGAPPGGEAPAKAQALREPRDAAGLEPQLEPGAEAEVVIVRRRR